MSDDRTPEQILTGIANDLKPEVDRLVSEIGAAQVARNINDSLARMAADRAARQEGRPIARFDFRDSTPDEARTAIKEGLEKEPTATRKVYAALAHKVWLLIRGDYSDEFRDWHDLLHGVRAYVRERDGAAVERLTALADLLRESISQAELDNATAPDPPQ